MPGRSADSSDPGSHMMGSIQHHSMLGQTINIGGIKYGSRIIDLKIQRGLIVHDNKEEIRLFFSDPA
jgi:hypothetical protein